MQYAMKAYDGPIGTLRSFFKEAFLRDKFLSLGIPLPAWSIPADADEDPDIPASATQLQMMVYNATIAKHDKLRLRHLYQIPPRRCSASAYRPRIVTGY